MKKVLLTLAILAHLSAWADGEQRFHIEGTRWVDPVEFYHLQDINYKDVQRTYYQGDIDVFKIIMEKGVKIYGMKLKPFAGANMINEFLSLEDDVQSSHVEYMDIYGIQGVPLNEASFCIYTDEKYTANYTFKYNWHGTIPEKNENGEKEKYKATSTATVNVTIEDLYIKNYTKVGPFFSHGFKAQQKDDIHWSDGDHSIEISKYDKILSIDEKQARFIYFKYARDLILMLSVNYPKTEGKDIATLNNGKYEIVHYSKAGVDVIASQKKYLSWPWVRIYFLVEQIMIGDGTLEPKMDDDDDDDIKDPYGKNTDDPNHPDNPEGDKPERGKPELTDQDKGELKEFLDNLIAWVKGESDPLGLEEHTDVKETAVINTISTVVSLLMGTTIASLTGSTGAEIASALTSSIIGGGGTPPPPPNMPTNTPNSDGLEPPRQDGKDDTDDEGGTPTGGDTPPPPPDPNKFNPSDYPAHLRPYVKQLPDGDIVFRNPANGEEMHFYSNGDGTWFTQTRGQDQPYTLDEIMGDHVRRQVENKSPLSSDALTAEHNRDVQHWLFEQENDRNRERGYSDEAIHQMKLDAEAEERRQDRLNEIAWRRRLADPTEENIKKDILKERKWERQLFKRAMKREAVLAATQNCLEIVDRTCETAVYAMASSVPGGPAIKDIYTFTKATGVSIVEAKVEKKGGWHVVRGIAKGSIGVLQHHVGDYYNKMPEATRMDTIKGALMGTLKPKEGLTFEQELENFVKEGVVWSGLQGPIGGMKSYEKENSTALSTVGGAAKGVAVKGGAYLVSKFTGTCIDSASTFKIPGVDGLVKAKGAIPTAVSKGLVNLSDDVTSCYNIYKAYQQYKQYDTDDSDW